MTTTEQGEGRNYWLYDQAVKNGHRPALDRYHGAMTVRAQQIAGILGEIHDDRFRARLEQEQPGQTARLQDSQVRAIVTARAEIAILDLLRVIGFLTDGQPCTSEDEEIARNCQAGEGTSAEG